MAAKKTDKTPATKKAYNVYHAGRHTGKGPCTCGPHLLPSEWCAKYRAHRKTTDL